MAVLLESETIMLDHSGTFQNTQDGIKMDDAMGLAEKHNKMV